MSLQTLRDRLPEYAKDLKLSLGTLAGETVLDETRKAGTFVAAAIASRSREVIEAVVAEFGPRLDPAAFTAAKAAAAIMAMNNVYYRFLHLVEDEEYAKLRAGLRMNVIANPGTARENFELWSLAVSAVVEDRDGVLSYWALRHPPGEPDFHHPGAFTLQLDEARH